MIQKVGKALYLPRGDTGSFALDLTGEAGDKVLFLITKDQTTLLRQIIDLVDGKFTVVLPDTTEWPEGSYRYQARLFKNAVVDGDNISGDEVDTPEGPQLFKVLEVLGDGTVHTESGAG